MPWCPGCAPQHSSAAPCPKKSPTGPSCPRWLMVRLRSPSLGGPRALHPHPQILLSPQPCPLPTPVALAWHRLAAFPTQRGRCQQRPALLLYGPPGKACRAHGPAPPQGRQAPGSWGEGSNCFSSQTMGRWRGAPTAPRPRAAFPRGATSPPSSAVRGSVRSSPVPRDPRYVA